MPAFPNCRYVVVLREQELEASSDTFGHVRDVSGQFDDLDSPAWSVVMDDDRAPRQRSERAEENDTTST